MKFKLFFFTVLMLSLVLVSPVLAKKRLVRSASSTSTSSASIWVKPRLRSDHNALILAFGNLSLAQDLSYRLTYISDSVPQGVEGSHQPEINSYQTELLFGTCSGTNCTYHQNLTEMFLEVTVKLISGSTLIQRYQINP